jgi:carbon catabolite-derepressing protein kinase
MPEKLTPLPASKLGEYTIIGDIAEGTFGKVRSGSRLCSTAAAEG